MNAIAGLVTEDPGQARELLGMLGDVFRDATRSASNHTVREEMEWLTRYIAIHALRFPDQFSVSWRVDPRTESLCIPALIMQPIVENALMHGVLKGEVGELCIETSLDQGSLRLVVTDTGPCLGSRRHEGKGMSLVERRLALHGDGKSRFELTRRGDLTEASILLTGARHD